MYRLDKQTLEITLHSPERVKEVLRDSFIDAEVAYKEAEEKPLQTRLAIFCGRREQLEALVKR